MASSVLRLYRNGLMNFQSARNIHLSSEFLEDSLKKGHTDSMKKGQTDLKKKGLTESGMEGQAESAREGQKESGTKEPTESMKKGPTQPMQKGPTEPMKKVPPEFVKKEPSDMEKKVMLVIKFTAIFLPGVYIGSLLGSNGYFHFKEKKTEEKISMFTGKDSEDTK